MKSANLFVLALIFFWGFGCGSGDHSESGSSDEAVPPAVSKYSEAEARICPIGGTILDGNRLLLPEAGMQVVLKADTATFDPDYGDSHRILEVYDIRNCSLLTQKILPVNVSPDFPYFLAEINYNHGSKLVAVRGAGTIYYLDAATGRLSPPLTPVFGAERYSRDAQSGIIQRLELWELFLVGCARDYGAFVFDLTDMEKPQAILPFGTYRDPEGERFHDLFLLPSEKGGVQALMPVYDSEQGGFLINALFPKPLDIEVSQGQTGQDTQFLVFREKHEGGVVYAVDLRVRKLVALPVDVGEADDATILGWLHQNQL